MVMRGRGGYKTRSNTGGGLCQVEKECECVCVRREECKQWTAQGKEVCKCTEVLKHSTEKGNSRGNRQRLNFWQPHLLQMISIFILQKIYRHILISVVLWVSSWMVNWVSKCPEVERAIWSHHRSQDSRKEGEKTGEGRETEWGMWSTVICWLRQRRRYHFCPVFLLS